MLTTSRRLSWLAVGIVGVLTCAGVVGCGAGKGDIRGKVTFRGEVLKGGTVTFADTTGGPSFTGQINEDGTYVVHNVRSGNYKVCVETESLKPRNTGSGGPPAGVPGAPPAGAASGGAGDLQNQVKSGKIKAGPPPGSEGGKAGYKDGFAVMAANAARYIPIPARYGKPETTDITYEAGRGSQTFDITLQDK